MRSILHLPRSSLLTRTAVPSAATARVTLSIPRRRSFTRSLATPSTSGYGDADQTGESAYPERAGSRPRIDTEHPGREPVDAGKGTGSGGTAETGSSKHSNKTSGKGYGEATSDGPGDLHKGGSSCHKNVFDMDDRPEVESADVKKHNREMDNRYDHKKAGPDEKVEKGYWNGE
ncbi:uncharacterized protein H6S33_006663 [Morchella sextelata]|uniref:uncharacterized protein n=1 Tax=Morchella sextelata TaxID=1174677 RepID=UPI001D03F933|nr:uncharacterized protein H6S33_006663 [Morchella sextelata]KAH0604286.1 hypothetical protein H6S33_006663 [Morchella sextelata]